MNRIRNKSTIPLTNATSYRNTSINSNSALPPGGPKLPKLKIEKFDGKIINWQTVWDQFESSINSQENITDIDKFDYLRYLLHDSARDFGTHTYIRKLQKCNTVTKRLICKPSSSS